ncbi:glutaminyl-peptide cyclotransferase [Hufsiella ginkgonis]|uniref:Glutaminyl-peptide cyclotransferase n=1 Tax=Hufsiella ginkgonis TaxID=2695274 RepID=A0A7K1XU04_9SPHI|nr:glutaminyl-peptide cyclotransferase [Hufsiella ginkgonis]MXV14464.1 glutaminyl-peptide cyclotransferase [Hufsiella ginkgonis]
MKKTLLLLLSAALLASCDPHKSGDEATILFPEAGARVHTGEELLIDVDFKDLKPDSVVYLLDNAVIARKTDTTAVRVPTAGLPMGYRLITAKVYSGAAPLELTSNIVLLAAKAPAFINFQVVKTFPHDTSSYVEGLEYHDGRLYESDGGKDSTFHGGSSLRLVDLTTGKVLKKIQLNTMFMEGITVIGDKIVQLTYQEKLMFIYDKNSFKKLSELPYTLSNEGWGLTSDGKHILASDGSSTVRFLNKNTYQQEGSIDVYDENGAVNSVNELEYIDGMLYANLYNPSGQVLVIDPATGEVKNKIDLSTLWPQAHRGDLDYVANGIAWDQAGKRLFVTGKLWDKLYEIKLLK